MLLVVFKKHNHKSKNHNGKKIKVIRTTCKIYESHPEDQEWAAVAVGEAKQNGLDKYDHVVGKRLAFSRALSDPTFYEPTAQWDRATMRGLRRAIWKEFYKKFAPKLDPGIKLKK